MMLNGWQRLGIVLSALWLLFVLCFVLFEAGVEVTVWRLLAAFSFPILAFWVIAYAALFAFRWVHRGFLSDRITSSSANEPIAAQSWVARSPPVDRPSQQPQQLEHVAPPQKQFEIKGLITKARNGEERLWVVFWFYIVLGGFLIRLLSVFMEAYLSAINIPAGWNTYRVTSVIFNLIFVVILVIYVTWAISSLWKCAFNVKRRWLGYLARTLVVWWLISLIFILVSILSN